MSVTLFKPEKLEKVDEFSHNLSFNHEFVERGFAEMAEEPYLSRVSRCFIIFHTKGRREIA